MKKRHTKDKGMPFNNSALTIAITLGIRKFTWPLCALPMVFASTLSAAEDPQNEAIEKNTPKKKTEVEVITVTARKFVESIQEVPSSVEVLNGSKLDQLGIGNFDDYALFLPSLSYQTAGAGQAQVYMRGASDGGDGNASGSQPSVAMYLDEQPVTAIGRNLDLHIYDIDRVEALAGPQSTLFGASSQSGTIRLISKKPSTAGFDAGADLDYNSTKHGGTGHVTEGFLNIPLGESTAIRLVGWNKEEAGFIDNVAGTRTYALLTNGGDFSTIQVNNTELIEKDFNELTNRGARVALRTEINDDWTTTISTIAQNQKSAGVWFHDPENTNDEVSDLEIQRFYPDSVDDKFQQSSLTIEGDLGFADLIYAGSFMERDVEVYSDYSDYSDYASTNWIQTYGCEYYGTADIDCTSMGIFYHDNNAYRRDTHEIRLQSNQDEQLKYVIGLYTEKSSHDYRQEWIMQGMAKGADFAQFGEPNLWYLTDQKRADKQHALFGEATFAFNRTWSLSLGGRYFENSGTLNGVSGYGVIAPGFPIIQVDSNAKDSGSILKTTLTFKASSDAMMYFTWSEGYRPGGINRDETTIVPRNYRADFIENLELGWKTSWFDNSVRFNGAIYQMYWDDMQLTRYDPSYGSPVGLTINVSEAEIFGIESSVVYQITNDWSLSTSVSYNEAALAKTLLVGTNLSPSGTELPNVPALKANMISRNYFTIAGRQLYFQASYAMVDTSYNDIFKYTTTNQVSDRRQIQDAYNILNLSAGIDQGTWGLSAYISNATDERAQLSRGSARWDSSISVNRPQSVGVQYYWRFN